MTGLPAKGSERGHRSCVDLAEVGDFFRLMPGAASAPARSRWGWDTLQTAATATPGYALAAFRFSVPMTPTPMKPAFGDQPNVMLPPEKQHEVLDFTEFLLKDAAAKVGL